jgi:hypothetical protein
MKGASAKARAPVREPEGADSRAQDDDRLGILSLGNPADTILLLPDIGVTLPLADLASNNDGGGVD